MARETQVVKVYPSDEAVRAKINLFEAFGWEVAGNQKITDKTGSYEGADGNYYTTTETYIQLTFSRDKAAPWYKEVVELEQAYIREENVWNNTLTQEPTKPKYISFFGVILVFTPLMPITLPLLIFNIIRQAKGKKKYKQEHGAWLLKKDAASRSVAEKQRKIKEEARALIEG